MAQQENYDYFSDSLAIQPDDLDLMDVIAHEAADDPNGTIRSVTNGCHMLGLTELARELNKYRIAWLKAQQYASVKSTLDLVAKEVGL